MASDESLENLKRKFQQLERRVIESPMGKSQSSLTQPSRSQETPESQQSEQRAKENDDADIKVSSMGGRGVEQHHDATHYVETTTVLTDKIQYGTERSPSAPGTPRRDTKEYLKSIQRTQRVVNNLKTPVKPVDHEDLHAELQGSRSNTPSVESQDMPVSINQSREFGVESQTSLLKSVNISSDHSEKPGSPEPHFVEQRHFQRYGSQTADMSQSIVVRSEAPMRPPSESNSTPNDLFATPNLSVAPNKKHTTIDPSAVIHTTPDDVKTLRFNEHLTQYATNRSFSGSGNSGENRHSSQHSLPYNSVPPIRAPMFQLGLGLEDARPVSPRPRQAHFFPTQPRGRFTPEVQAPSTVAYNIRQESRSFHPPNESLNDGIARDLPSASPIPQPQDPNSELQLIGSFVRSKAPSILHDTPDGIMIPPTESITPLRTFETLRTTPPDSINELRINFDRRIDQYLTHVDEQLDEMRRDQQRLHVELHKLTGMMTVMRDLLVGNVSIAPEKNDLPPHVESEPEASPKPRSSSVKTSQTHISTIQEEVKAKTATLSKKLRKKQKEERRQKKSKQKDSKRSSKRRKNEDSQQRQTKNPQ